jgi:Flp pilus assembly protein TadG
MVEFALIAPIFLTLILGMTELGHAYQVSANLSMAVREGGRMASMDMTEKLASGQTLNQKVIADMRNLLTANGIPGADATITITHTDSTATFDLSNEDNYLATFRVSVSIPYSKVSAMPADYMLGSTMSHSAVYRMGRAMVTN